ncbi:disintegrin and metalloproteinase domain-containing protein 12 precursor [Cricetulus griseus]|nr:disintegrin and metalloproteinase domain-containing protein 12 precursor [Cricetulus griseus]
MSKSPLASEGAAMTLSSPMPARACSTAERQRGSSNTQETTDRQAKGKTGDTHSACLNTMTCVFSSQDPFEAWRDHPDVLTVQLQLESRELILSLERNEVTFLEEGYMSIKNEAMNTPKCTILPKRSHYPSSTDSHLDNPVSSLEQGQKCLHLSLLAEALGI